MVRAAAPIHGEWGRGWTVVFATFLSHFIGYGTVKALGVLITPVMDDLGTNLWIIGSITTVYYNVQLALVPVAAAVARKIGYRYVITFGGALYGLGLILASVCHNVVAFALMLVMAASGAACVTETTRAAIAFYFYERFSQATFIAISGDPIGIMVYGPVTQVALGTYGWRGTMLLLGAVGCHFVVCGLLVKEPAGKYAGVSTARISSVTVSPDPVGAGKPKKICQRIKLFLDSVNLEFLLDPEFIVITASLTLTNIAYAGVVVYMVPNGLSLGLGSTHASFLTVAWGIGNIAGYGLTSLTLQRRPSSTLLVATSTGLLSVACLAANGSVTSFVVQMVVVAGIGAGLGGIAMVDAVLMRNIKTYSDDQLVNIFCWKSSLCGVGVSLAGLVTGWLYDVTGSFQASYLWCGALTTMSVVLVFVHRYLEYSRRRPNR